MNLDVLRGPVTVQGPNSMGTEMPPRGGVSGGWMLLRPFPDKPNSRSGTAIHLQHTVEARAKRFRVLFLENWRFPLAGSGRAPKTVKSEIPEVANWKGVKLR